MRKLAYLAPAVLALGVALFAAPQGKTEDKQAARTLKVKLNYTGSGTVDEKHKIVVFLFDSADFTQGGVMPFAMKMASAKNETVTFEGFTASPVFVAVCYDPSGGYDGESGPPPSGASMGIYSKTPGKPEPINVEPGKTVEVEVAFDDTAKMP